MHKLQEEIDKTVTMLYRPPEMADIEMNYRQGYAIGTAVDVWMLGCILYTLAFYRHPFQDNAFAMAIWNAKYYIPQDHPMARSQKLVALIHWMLAADPKDRPSAGGAIEASRGIGKIEYADFLGSLPSSVQKKIAQGEALYTKRRDVAPPPEWDLSKISGGAATGGSRSSGTRNGSAKADRPQHESRPSQEPEFDLRFALSSEDSAPSASSGGYGETRRGASNGGYAAASKPAQASSPPDDLLSLGEPPSNGNGNGKTAGLAHSAASVPAMDDLLGFGAPDAATPSRAKSAPAAASQGGDLLGFADFDGQAFQAASPGTAGQQTLAFSQPATNASADFADFSSAPAPDFGDFQQSAFGHPSQPSQVLGSQPMGIGQPGPLGSPPMGIGQPGPLGSPPMGIGQPGPMGSPPMGMGQPGPMGSPPMGMGQPSPMGSPPMGTGQPSPMGFPPMGMGQPGPMGSPPMGMGQSGPMGSSPMGMGQSSPMGLPPMGTGQMSSGFGNPMGLASAAFAGAPAMGGQQTPKKVSMADLDPLLSK